MGFIKTIRYIRKEVKKIVPDAIICYTKFYAAIANLALLNTSYNVFVTERSSPLYHWPRKIEWFCKLSFTLRKPKGVISQTSIASKYHQKYYGNTKYFVIPNAVRTINTYKEIEREPFILAVGRFHDSCKGFDLLVKAFNRLENKTWKLVFAGGSIEEGKYLLDLANPEVTSRIEFLGVVKNMDALYARAGIFAIPSRSEGFPNALAEAMTAGCCCVSFDFVAGPRDLINNGVNGVLVEANNINSLAETLDNLISNSIQRQFLGINAQEIYKNLNGIVITKKYLSILSYG